MKCCFFILMITLLASCQQKPRYMTVDGAMLGTTFHIVALTDLSSSEIYQITQDIDRQSKQSMSIFDESSLLSRVNQNMSDSIDRHIKTNIATAGRIYEISDGLYDITVKPLTDAYGFARKEKQGKISREYIDSLLGFVGFSKISIKGNRLVKENPGVQIDLNSIAKGYTVDWVADSLEVLGCQNYIVEVGGEIRAKGINPKSRMWRVAVDLPFEGNQEPGKYEQTVVEVSDAALATSGNYRRFYSLPSGQKIVHTINPKTGDGAISPLVSVTVKASRCVLADGLATMFMAVGEDKARELAEKMKDTVQVYFVSCCQDSDEFRVYTTFEEDNVDK